MDGHIFDLGFFPTLDTSVLGTKDPGQKYSKKDQTGNFPISSVNPQLLLTMNSESKPISFATTASTSYAESTNPKIPIGSAINNNGSANNQTFTPIVVTTPSLKGKGKLDN